MSAAVPLTQAVTSGDANAVRAAIANGADVNERNNGGQTALILAVIFGHAELVRLLVNAGADPRLRDNLGLDAIEWAQRRGLPVEVFKREQRPVAPTPLERTPPETPVDADEKSRKWLAGVKQRIQEQSARKEPVVETRQEPEPTPELTPEPEPAREPELARELGPAREPEPAPELSAAKRGVEAAAKQSFTRKRCPKCNAIYNSELVAYCAHHFVRLVDANEPMFEPPPSAPITSSPLLWMLILVTVSIAAFTGYLITSQLSRVIIPDTPAAAPQQPTSFLKGTPVADGDLAGKSVTLPEAECPLFEGDNRTNAGDAAQTINVRLKIDKSGKVFWARAEGGDDALRNAATEAATRSTFAPDKLRGRETEGTITYTFAP